MTRDVCINWDEQRASRSNSSVLTIHEVR